MTSSRFDSEELSFIDQSAHDFIARKSEWRSYIPYETIPWARKSEWKVADAIHEAAATLDGSRTNLAATSYTWDEAPLGWLGYHFEWSELEMEIARQSGNKVRMDDIRFAYEHLDRQIERAFWQGSMVWDRYAVPGIIGTEVDALASAPDWDDAGGPYEHAKIGWGVMHDSGFDGPYTWVMSRNLQKGMFARDLATEPHSAKNAIMEAWEIDKMVFVGQGAPAQDANTINAFPAPGADDGRWVMFKADKNNALIQEVFAPKLTVIPEMDQKRKKFYARLDYFFTVKNVHTTSFCTEDSVDLAT